MPSLVSTAHIILKGLLVGFPGVGKTSTFATAADCEEMSPVLALDFEGGLLSVSHRKDIWEERIRTIAELEALFWNLANRDKSLELDGVFPKTVIPDSGSALADLCLEEIARAAFQAYRQTPDKLAARADQDDVQLKDYGKSTRRMTRIFRWFRDVPDVNVLMTALPSLIYPSPPSNDDKSKRAFEDNVKRGLIKPMEIKPLFTNKLCTNVLGYQDFAWFLNQSEVAVEGQTEKKQQRKLITRPWGALRYIKTRGAKVEAILNGVLDVECVPGQGPTIEGVPAMKYIYDLYVKHEAGAD